MNLEDEWNIFNFAAISIDFFVIKYVFLFNYEFTKYEVESTKYKVEKTRYKEVRRARITEYINGKKEKREQCQWWSYATFIPWMINLLIIYIAKYSLPFYL